MLRNRQRKRYKKTRPTMLVLYTLLCFSICSIVETSHFRGGTISWKHVRNYQVFGQEYRNIFVMYIHTAYMYIMCIFELGIELYWFVSHGGMKRQRVHV